MPPEPLIEIHLLDGDVGELAAVGGAANADVGVHLLHPLPFEPAGQLQGGLAAGAVERPEHGIVLPGDQRDGSSLVGQVDQPAHQFGRREIVGFDEDFLAGLQLAAMVDEYFSEAVQAWVVHAGP